jgi:hypothetical protein
VLTSLDVSLEQTRQEILKELDPNFTRAANYASDVTPANLTPMLDPNSTRAANYASDVAPANLTPIAQEALGLARREAERFNHNFIGTEHILLGLVREEDGVAPKVLSNLGVTLPKVRSSVEFIIGRGEKPTPSEIGLTPRAKKVIELAVDEARRLNHAYIGTEHILIGLVREGEGIAFGVLESLGVSLERVRTETTRLLSQSIPRQTASGAPEQSPVLVALVPDDTLKARALSLLQAAQTAILAYEGTAIEQTVIGGFVVPRIAALIESLDEQVSIEALSMVREGWRERIADLRGLQEALAAQGQEQMAQALGAALSAYVEALRD